MPVDLRVTPCHRQDRQVEHGRHLRQKWALPRCTSRYGAPWLTLANYAAVVSQSDHAFDAVIAALTARAAYTRQVHKTSNADHGKAETEGWIAPIPCAPLG